MDSGDIGDYPAPPGPEPRVRDDEDGSGRARRSRVGRGLRPIVGLGAVVLLAGMLLEDWSQFPLLVSAGLWGSAAVGVMLLLGRAGLLSLGQSALVGVAAYASGYAAINWNWGAPAAITFAALVTVAIAAVAAPILRLDHFYFALATLCMVIIVERLLGAWRGVTGGAAGLGVLPTPQFGPVSVAREIDYFYVSWGLVILAMLVVRNLSISRVGRGLEAIRIDPELAASLGVPVVRYKIYVWLMSAGFAAMSGSMYAYYNRFISPENFSLVRSIEVLAAVVVGGATALVGPALGVFAILVVPSWLNIGTESTALARTVQ